jgi:hypothetical protein
MTNKSQYDVFLCHNSKEKEQVEKIREQLRQKGILAWLDKYDFEPFRPWQDQLEEIIPQMQAVAVFIGSSGVGPWADIEMREFLNEFARRQIRMGLVILPGCPQELVNTVPRFMKGFHWVDFRQQDPNPMEQLIWGITGKKPEEVDAKADESETEQAIPADDENYEEGFQQLVRGMRGEYEFDVFLAHHSGDKPLVRTINNQLKKRGIKPWIDEEQIAPGRSFQQEIQEAIPVVKTAAILIGEKGLGRWQARELESFYREFVEKDKTVIPVLLPGVDEVPESLPLLRNLRWINFKSIDDKKALELLVWGITGARRPDDLLDSQKLSQSPHDQDNQITKVGKLVWGVQSGDLPIPEKRDRYTVTVLVGQAATVNLRNFIVEVQFYNPYETTSGNLAYGISFRDNTSQDFNDSGRKGFTLWIESDSEGNSWNFSGDTTNLNGKIPHFNIFENASNKLRLNVLQDDATFFVNDEYIEKFDVSSLTEPGNVFLVTKDGVSGKSIKYDNFRIWSLEFAQKLVRNIPSESVSSSQESKDTAVAPKQQAETLLNKLLPAQLKQVIFRYDIDEAYLPSNASQVETAIAVIRYARQKEGDSLSELLNTIYDVAPHLKK